MKNVIRLGQEFFQQKARERKINRYSTFHEYARDAEDRMKLYIPFYEELQTILQDDPLESEIRKKISKLSKDMEELIGLEHAKRSQTITKRDSLLKELNSDEGGTR